MMAEPAANYRPPSRRPKVLRPNPESIAVMEGVRFSDLQTFLTRMERMATRRWDRARVWGAVAVLCLGGAIGGAFGLFPFLSATPHPASEAKLVYFGAMGAALVVALLSLLARLSVIEERGDSVRDLRDDFNRWLAAYRQEVSRAEATLDPRS